MVKPDKWENMEILRRRINTVRLDYLNDMVSDVPTKKSLSALIISLIDKASFRIGSGESDTFGVSTLRPEHVEFVGGETKFEFVGKKSVVQRKRITDATTNRYLKVAKEFSASKGCAQLFCYADDGKTKKITDDDVRDYLEGKAGIRTVHSFRHLKANQMIENGFKNGESYEETLPKVVEELGHVRTSPLTGEVVPDTGETAEKSYIHPSLTRGRSGRRHIYSDIRKEHGVPTRREMISELRLNPTSRIRGKFFANTD